METENKPKSKVITLNKNKTQMRFVQMTLCQFEKFFSNDIVNVLSQKRTLLFPVNGKIRKTSFVKMTINSTECLVVNLFRSAFTNRFGGGKFKVYTKHIVTFEGPDGNVSVIERQPEPVVIEQPTPLYIVEPINEMVVPELPSINIPKPEPQSEKTDTGRSTNRKPIKTKVIPFPTNCLFSYNYSIIIRLTPKIPSTSFYLSNVG